MIAAKKTSGGLDVDTVPAQFGLHLRHSFHGTMVPTYPGGASPPVLSFTGVHATDRSIRLPDLFASGSPAVLAALTEDAIPTDASSAVALANQLNGFSLDKTSDHGFDADATARPLWFGTDSTLGVMLEFMGPKTRPFPQSFLIGSRDKTLLVAPLMVTRGQDGTQVHTPSTIAVNDQHHRHASLLRRLSPLHSSSSSRHFLATGVAATLLARRPDVRAMLNQPIEFELRQWEEELLQAANSEDESERLLALDRLAVLYQALGKDDRPRALQPHGGKEETNSQ